MKNIPSHYKQGPKEDYKKNIASTRKTHFSM